MRKYLIGRFVQILFTLLIFQTLLFVILDAQPGDITMQFLANPKVSPEAREQIRANLGLDRPPLERYAKWLVNFSTGNLGTSFEHWPRSVMDIILERAPRTLILFLTGQLIAFVVGFSLGKLLAWWRGGVLEYGLTLVGVVMYTIFTPWFGLMMIWFFGFRLKWLPVGKFLDPLLWRKAEVDANFVFGRLMLTALAYTVLVLVVFIATRKLSAVWRRAALWAALVVFAGAAVLLWSRLDVGVLALDMVRHMVLPLCVYTLVNFAGTMLVMRNTMLETLREDYVMAARAKGLSERVVRDQHAARNAFLPVFTALIIGIPFAISGGIITETIFSWPGMGLTLLSAVQNEDIPMAMGALSFIGVLALLAHLVADIAYSFLDPRIRYQ